MNDDEARKFAEILRAELLREHPEVAREVPQMRRGMRSPSRIFLIEERRSDGDVAS
ncbi:hypothetical protein [Streptomyces coelicoflavus]|uniref:hypothetical protein n=1 Tax=Streptomyces coelicoflavus TaxID=285562 RepID=UPI00131F1FFC|nr:hypothetical protein [Streptomyces coelicoflavus]